TTPSFEMRRCMEINLLMLGSRDERGFTLIELLVVVIILGILTAIAVPSYLSFRGRSNDAAAKANVRTIIPDIEQYNADNNGYAGDRKSVVQGTSEATSDPRKN